MKILLGDLDGAKQAAEDYFTGVYQGQIDANGEQPLEASRTRPYHYRSYALSAMVVSRVLRDRRYQLTVFSIRQVNGRLADYVGYNGWGHKTSKGGTIQKAADFVMNVDPGDEPQSGLFPNIATVGSVYGDANKKYSSWLKGKDSTYSSTAYFLFDQPLVG